MTRAELLASAARLAAPSAEAATEYESKAMHMAEEINRIMDLRPDVKRLVGEDNLEMMHDNHRNHARFIASLLQAYNPEVFVDTVIWVFRAYLAHGFSLTYWPAQLDTWVELFNCELSEATRREVYPFYHWMIINQAHFVALAMSSLESAKQEPHH
jgi:hypothetical protein